MSWLDILRDNTHNIYINDETKTITLVHPHWSTGKDKGKYRHLLKEIKRNSYKGYHVSVFGFISLEGMIIVARLQNFLNQLNDVDYTKLNINKSLATYNLEVQFR